MGLHTEKDQKRYLTIMSDGKLHERVDEDVEGAKERTKKEQDGTVTNVVDKEGNQIWELTYPGITAKITKIQLREGDYGTSINIDLVDEDDNQFVLSLKVDSQYGERFMEALPNLDLTEDVEFKGYSFKPKGKDQKIRGLNILQDEEKVRSAFAVKDEDSDEWEVLIKGYPMPDPKKKYNAEKWKIFFATRREWVQDYLLEAEMILPADAPTEEAEDEDAEEESEDEETEEEAPVKKAVKKATAKKGEKDPDDF
jgi:hypothetical protein